MSAPTFSLAYTSVRPSFIPQIMEAWFDRSKKKDMEFVVCVDDGDRESLNAAAQVARTFTVPVKVVTNTGPKNCVAGWNKAAENTSGQVIIAMSDDLNPPQNWDEQFLALEPKGWIDGDYAVHTEDGYVHDIMVLGVITRKRYEKFGYLFYPKYQSIFCDTELSEVAYRDGVVINAKHILVEHLHPDCNKRQRDQADLVHASKQRWDSGEMIFKFRKAHGFPIDDGPKAAKEEPRTQGQEIKFAVYMQVIKDDLCLGPVCQRILEEGCRDFFLAVPDEYWSGEAVAEADRQTLEPVVKALTEAGAAVRVKIFHVPSYRISPADSRIVVETRVRNDSLAWIRKEGFEHIIIVDGDELWMPGTLELIRPYVEQGHAAVSLRMIPVIGTPGYPVDSASDAAVVYIGRKCDFKVCRSPNAQQTILETPRIIHFTSTRRTLEENIAKHRRSGHYDDPQYAFEEWIKGVLPVARPGMEHVHMYRPHSIWPRIRNWRPEELAIIPPSIHPYLGR